MDGEHRSRARFSRSVLRRPCQTIRWRWYHHTQPVCQCLYTTRWCHLEKQTRWMTSHTARHASHHIASQSYHQLLHDLTHGEASLPPLIQAQRAPLYSNLTFTFSYLGCNTEGTVIWLSSASPNTSGSPWTFHPDTSQLVHHRDYAWSWLCDFFPSIIPVDSCT